MEGKETKQKDMTPILIKDLGMEYPTKNSKQKKRYGIFQCQYCGKEFKTTYEDIKKGNTKSCGCLSGKKHGLRHHRFYSTWASMKQRCYNMKSKGYINYGGRGIGVCEEWLDAENFIKWAEENHINGCTLDRIDNDKGYSPENCRWADATTQVINRRKPKSNTSGFVAVYWQEHKKSWRVRLSINKKRISLGCYKNIEDAVKARDDYIIKYNLSYKLSTEY